MSTKIDSKLKVTLGGLPQKIHVKSNDTTLPVLLFLHGGPGVINRHGVLGAHADLLDTFTLATWDQRGSGGSYWGAARETLTVQQLTDDAAELVSRLCKRFDKDKIFIIGGSWGSELGTHLAYQYPAKIAAYVGFGQMVDGTRNEELSYAFTLDAAIAAGDTKAVAVLEELGKPERGQYKGGFAGMMTQRRIMMKYGGYSQNTKKRSYFSSIVKPMLLSGEYSVSDLIGVALGYKYVLQAMWPEVGSTDLLAACPKFEIPYFIFDGRLDQNTPAELVEDYFNAITAVHKELIWFENSGHNPMGDEPERFKTLLREKLTAVVKAEQERGVVL
ncbi:MAG: alpha/beta hydrolase [Propionibacteriaceae bacterium]|jgi:pimeloyl-ACP methyl ester carboxylesterase|nr:alpha/beta hydrolase [Propionibacteriaceae bacterium]